MRTVQLSCLAEGTGASEGGHVSIDFLGKEKNKATLHWSGRAYLLDKVRDSSSESHYGADLNSFQFWEDGPIVNVTFTDSNFYECSEIPNSVPK